VGSLAGRGFKNHSKWCSSPPNETYSRFKLHYKCGTNFGPVQAQRPNVAFLVMNLKLSHTQTSKCRMTSYDPPTLFLRNNNSTSGTEKAPTGPTARGGHQTYIMQKNCSVFFPIAFRSSDSGILDSRYENRGITSFIFIGVTTIWRSGGPQPFIYTNHVNV
jgi:hypothetical protein